MIYFSFVNRGIRFNSFNLLTLQSLHKVSLSKLIKLETHLFSSKIHFSDENTETDFSTYYARTLVPIIYIYILAAHYRLEIFELIV